MTRTKVNKKIISYKKVISDKKNKFNHAETIIIKDIPSKITYESFKTIILNDSLCYFDSSLWKSMVNIVDKNDNSFPLYWACNRRNIKTINLLIDNGAIYYPYDLDINKFESSMNKKYILKMIIFNLKDFSTVKLKIDFKKFCNVKINQNEINFNNIYNEYILIIKLLISKFPNIVNDIDEMNFNIVYYFLFFSYFDICKIILDENINIESVKNISENLTIVYRKLKHEFDNLKVNDDYQIILKEFFRYNILNMFDYLKNMFIFSKILVSQNKQLKYDIVVKNYFGTFESYNSIFFKLYIDNSDDDDFKTGMYTLNILSNFQNNELNYNNRENFYNIMCNKFNEKYNYFDHLFLDSYKQ